MAIKKDAVNQSDKVDEYMKTFEHPFEEEIAEVRKIIMKANSKMMERVKWNAPSFFYKDFDFGAFNPRTTDKVQLVLVFPKGIVENNSSLLEGEYKDRRLVHFKDMEDVKDKKKDLENIVNEWIKLID